MTISLAYTLCKYKFLEKFLNNIEEISTTEFKLNNSSTTYKLQPTLLVTNDNISKALSLLNIEVNKKYYPAIQSVLLLMNEKISSCFIEKETQDEMFISVILSNSTSTAITIQKYKGMKSNYIAANMLLEGWQVMLGDNIRLVGPLGTTYTFTDKDCSCQEFIINRRKKPCCHLSFLDSIQNNKKLFL